MSPTMVKFNIGINSITVPKTKWAWTEMLSDGKEEHFGYSVNHLCSSSIELFIS